MRAAASLSFSRSSGPIESKRSACWGSFNSPKVTSAPGGGDLREAGRTLVYDEPGACRSLGCFQNSCRWKVIVNESVPSLSGGGFCTDSTFLPASELHRVLKPLLVHCLLDLLSLRKTQSIMRSVIRRCAACEEGDLHNKTTPKTCLFFFHVVSISLGFQVQDLPSPHTPSEAVAPTGCRTARPHRQACWLWSPGGRELPPRPYDWPGHRATPGYPPNTTFQTLVATSGPGLGVNATNPWDGKTL